MSSAAFSVSKNISYERPEHPPGRTATRRYSSGWPSAAISSLTFVVAVSVRAIIWASVGNSSQEPVSGYFDGNGDPARVPVVQRRELLDCSPAHRRDHAFADSSVQVAHELRVGLGELAERAMQERDVGAATRQHLPLGIETEPVHLAVQRLHA